MGFSENFPILGKQPACVCTATDYTVKTRPVSKEVLIKAGLVDLQFKTSESKAKIVSHSTAMGKIFNAGIAGFGCKGLNQALISASLSYRWGSTEAGTNAETSPPMLEISRINREETNV